MERRSVTDAEVVICVHDAWEHVCRCLASVTAYTDPRHRLIIVDDASGPQCRSQLDQFVSGHRATNLLRNDSRLGYTKSANRGLRQSRAQLVVLLNSDTVVTPHWLERLRECATSDAKIGMVGPLSNAATFQSVPERYDGASGWVFNSLPPGWTPNDVADVIARIASRAFPRVGLLNGFCFAIKRTVVETIGYFDELNFPDGYGEEQDYCFRAAKAGFALAVADHAYVYHAWNQSYGSANLKELKEAGQAAQLRKHKSSRIRAAILKTHDGTMLESIRQGVAAHLHAVTPFSAASLVSTPRVAPQIRDALNPELDS